MHEGKQVRDKPYFKHVRFRINEDSNVSLLALKSGEIDELMLTPEQWTTQTSDDAYYARNTKARGLEWTNFQFTWNLDTPFFDDLRSPQGDVVRLQSRRDARQALLRSLWAEQWHLSPRFVDGAEESIALLPSGSEQG